MNQQTYDYISLKALSDRFREVAATITNDDIKSIIKSQIEEKVKDELYSVDILLSEIVNEWFEDEDNATWILNTLKKSIENKLSDKKRRNIFSLLCKNNIQE